jgi:NADH:ubiquinone reductase (H+-translocating)
MPEKNIVIAGGGFAGISALRRIKRHRDLLERKFKVILVDRKPFFEFLPMLPDVVGGWMSPDALRIDLKYFAGRAGAEFVKGRVENVDACNREITVEGEKIAYEYAILATGSKTNFYGNSNLRDFCFKLDNVDDAVRIRDLVLRRVLSGAPTHVLIAGGGYTGVEIATNLRFLLKGKGGEFRVSILEKAEDILMAIPEWIRMEVKRELEKLGIEIITGDSLKDYDGNNILLESGKKISDAVCIWTAGVKTSGYLAKLGFSAVRTRVVVDERLCPKDQRSEGVFIAGDSASFSVDLPERPLRMAIMFAMGQGKTAADNVLRGIKKKTPGKYRPVDLGYLIPMAHGKAFGTVMGIKARGLAGYLLHYFMCVYRSEWGNRKDVLKSLLSKSVKNREGGKNGKK